MKKTDMVYTARGLESVSDIYKKEIIFYKNYVRSLDEELEKVKKEKKELIENRKFIEKYFHYILIVFMIMILILI